MYDIKSKCEPLKNAAYIAILAMIVLLIGAIIFYKERILFVDASYMSFLRINTPILESSERRYGAYITQAVPLLGAVLHLPLKVILILYSISYNLFYLIVIIILVKKFKQYGLAILMALYYTLFVTDTYFWTINEVHQGIAWLFLFLGVSLHLAKMKANLIIQIPIFIVLASLALFTHPLVIVSAIFIWFFLWIDRRSWPYSRVMSIILSLILVGIIALKIFLSNQQGYDNGKMHNTLNISLIDIFHAFTNGMNRTFYNDIFSRYWCAIPILLIGIIALLRGKNYLLLTWSVVCIIGFIALMGITYTDSYDYHTRFYMESEWLTLTIPVAFAFVFYGMPLIKNKTRNTIFITIFLIRFSYISFSSIIFTHRIDYINLCLSKMKQLRIKKAYITKSTDVEDKLLMTWGLPLESLMLSKINHDSIGSTIMVCTEEEYKNISKDKNTFSSCFFSPYNYNSLNTKYFNFDTSKQYVKLNL